VRCGFDSRPNILNDVKEFLCAGIEEVLEPVHEVSVATNEWDMMSVSQALCTLYFFANS